MPTANSMTKNSENANTINSIGKSKKTPTGMNMVEKMAYEQRTGERTRAELKKEKIKS